MGEESPSAASPAPEGGLVITVNGRPVSMAVGSTAGDVVNALGWEGRPLAVEINESVVPRSELGARTVHHGDRIEVVTLVGGG